MVTAQSIICLCEDYFNTKKVFNKDVVIYRNPTISDYKELMRVIKSAGVSDLVVRFIINAKKQSIYVWDARLANHDHIATIVGSNMLSDNLETWILAGEGSVVSGRIVPDSWRGISGLFFRPAKWIYAKDLFANSNGKNVRLLLEFFSYNWSFVDKYIQGFNQELSQLKIESEKPIPYLINNYL